MFSSDGAQEVSVCVSARDIIDIRCLDYLII